MRAGPGPGRAGRDAPSWSCPAGGGQRGLEALRAGSTGGWGPVPPRDPSEGFSPTRPPEEVPQPSASRPQEDRPGVQGALASPGRPGEGALAPPLTGAWISFVGSQKKEVQRSLGRRLVATVLGPNTLCLRFTCPGGVGTTDQHTITLGALELCSLPSSWSGAERCEGPGSVTPQPWSCSHVVLSHATQPGSLRLRWGNVNGFCLCLSVCMCVCMCIYFEWGCLIELSGML